MCGSSRRARVGNPRQADRHRTRTRRLHAASHRPRSRGSPCGRASTGSRDERHRSPPALVATSRFVRRTTAVPLRPPGTGWDNRMDMRCPSCGNENREGADSATRAALELTAAAGAAGAAGRAARRRRAGEIAGRYRVKRFLAQGGRKRVYLADDTASGPRGRGRALRHRRGRRGRDPGQRPPRGRRRCASSATTRTSSRVHDTGEEDGNPFIVSQLHARRRRRGPARRRRRALEVEPGGRDRHRRLPRPRARPRAAASSTAT